MTSTTIPDRPEVTAAFNSGQGQLQRIAPSWRTTRARARAARANQKAKAKLGHLHPAVQALTMSMVYTTTISYWLSAACLWWGLAASAWCYGITMTIGLGWLTWPLRVIRRLFRRSDRRQAAEQARHDQLMQALQQQKDS